MFNPEMILVLGQQAAPQASPLAMWGPFVIIAVMVFFLFFSQNKEKKRRQSMLDGIRSGDRVVTVGGVHGEITSVKEHTFILKIADNVKIEISKGAVASVGSSEQQVGSLS